MEGIYHIQHLNSYHARLEPFLATFDRVSSKYPNNYLTWNNIVEHKGGGSLSEKARRLLEKVLAVLFEETCLAVSLRPMLPLLVKNQSYV